MTAIAVLHLLVKTWEKVDFELSNSPFWGFSTKILLLKHGFPLTRFFKGPKNRGKGGVPVLEKKNHVLPNFCKWECSKDSTNKKIPHLRIQELKVKK